MYYICAAIDRRGCILLMLPLFGMMSEDEALENFDWILYHRYRSVYEKTFTTEVREAEHDEEV